MDARTSDRIVDLIEINGRLVGENLRLHWENEVLRKQVDELRVKLQDYWNTVEDVACGAKMECAVCGQSKPCKCDTK